MELYIIAMLSVCFALLVIGVILYICIKKKYKSTEDDNLDEVVIETSNDEKQPAEDDNLDEVVIETSTDEKQPAEDDNLDEVVIETSSDEKQPAEDDNLDEVVIEISSDEKQPAEDDNLDEVGIEISSDEKQPAEDDNLDEVGIETSTDEKQPAEDDNLDEVVIETSTDEKQPAEDDNLDEVVIETSKDENQPAEDNIDNQTDSASEKRVTVEDFIFHKVLGKGSYGKVVLCQLKGKNEFFAIKAMKKRRVSQEDTMREKRILTLAWEHPFLSPLYCSFQTNRYLFLVMELLNGDLLGHLKDQTRFDLHRATFYGAEISCGLQFLHSKKIIHRDLKLENVMLDKDGHIKIIDFGMSIENISNDRKANSCCGTPDYMAPEILHKQSYTFSVDWWSFGVLLYRMLIGKPPFLGPNKHKTYRMIKENTPKYPKWISEESRDILQQLLEKEPTKRLGVRENIRLHPFFNAIDWTALERREVEPPFKPKVESPSSIRNFVQKLLRKNYSISFSEDQMDSEDKTEFCGFSVINTRMQEIIDS